MDNLVGHLTGASVGAAQNSAVEQLRKESTPEINFYCSLSNPVWGSAIEQLRYEQSLEFNPSCPVINPICDCADEIEPLLLIEKFIKKINEGDNYDRLQIFFDLENTFAANRFFESVRTLLKNKMGFFVRSFFEKNSSVFGYKNTEERNRAYRECLSNLDGFITEMYKLDSFRLDEAIDIEEKNNSVGDYLSKEGCVKEREYELNCKEIKIVNKGQKILDDFLAFVDKTLLYLKVCLRSYLNECKKSVAKCGSSFCSGKYINGDGKRFLEAQIESLSAIFDSIPKKERKDFNQVLIDYCRLFAFRKKFIEAEVFNDFMFPAFNSDAKRRVYHSCRFFLSGSETAKKTYEFAPEIRPYKVPGFDISSDFQKNKQDSKEYKAAKSNKKNKKDDCILPRRKANRFFDFLPEEGRMQEFKFRSSCKEKEEKEDV